MLFADPSQLALSVFQKINIIIPFSQVFISIVPPYLKQLKTSPRLCYFFNKITSVHSKSPNILERHSPRVLITSDPSARPESGIQRSCNKISKIKIWSIIKFNLRRIDQNVSARVCMCSCGINALKSSVTCRICTLESFKMNQKLWRFIDIFYGTSYVHLKFLDNLIMTGFGFYVVIGRY